MTVSSYDSFWLSAGSKHYLLLYNTSEFWPLGLGTKWGLQIYPWGMSEADPCEPLRYVTGLNFSFFFLNSFIMSRIPSQIIESTIWYESCKKNSRAKIRPYQRQMIVMWQRSKTAKLRWQYKYRNSITKVQELLSKKNLIRPVKFCVAVIEKKHFHRTT